MAAASGTLILGWGNPGRLDDGLGPALVAEIQVLLRRLNLKTGNTQGRIDPVTRGSRVVVR